MKRTEVQCMHAVCIHLLSFNLLLAKDNNKCCYMGAALHQQRLILNNWPVSIVEFEFIIRKQATSHKNKHDFLTMPTKSIKVNKYMYITFTTTTKQFNDCQKLKPVHEIESITIQREEEKSRQQPQQPKIIITKNEEKQAKILCLYTTHSLSFRWHDDSIISNDSVEF